MSDPFLNSDFDRLQQHLDSFFRGAGLPARLRAMRSGAFPAVNIGATDDAIEIVAFAAGLDPATLDVSIDKGLLTISGSRPSLVGTRAEGTNVHALERFAGSFRRVIELPEHADPEGVQARYVDGCLRISIRKRESSKPQRVQIQ